MRLNWVPKPGGLTELGALERRATFELGPIDVGRSLESDAIKLGVPPKASTVEPRFSDKLYAVELGAPTELRLSEDSHRVEGATEDGVPPETQHRRRWRHRKSAHGS